MSKFAVCNELFILLLLVVTKRSEVQHGLAAKCQTDILRVIPDLQASKEATIVGFDCVRFTRRYHVHMIQLVEVLCSIPPR